MATKSETPLSDKPDTQQPAPEKTPTAEELKAIAAENVSEFFDNDRLTHGTNPDGDQVQVHPLPVAEKKEEKVEEKPSEKTAEQPEKKEEKPIEPKSDTALALVPEKPVEKKT